MPHLRCTRCDRPVLLPDNAPAGTACPQCGGELHALAPTAPAPESGGAATIVAAAVVRPGVPGASDPGVTVRSTGSPAGGGAGVGATVRESSVRGDLPGAGGAVGTLRAPSAELNNGATLKAPAGGRRGSGIDVTAVAARDGVAVSDVVPRKGPGSEGTPYGRYRLLSMLGQGGMGVVWKAWDTELRRMVALKQIKHEDAGDEEATKRFLREARLAAKLRHQHIIGIHDVGEIEGRHYITMDFVDGKTLAGWLEDTAELKKNGSRKGMDRLRHEVRLLADVAAAVAYAHAEGIIHRDLKPSNVLVDQEEHPYVMDFGLAKEIGTGGDPESAKAMTQMTMSGHLLGTPAYMSPEQAAGDTPKIGPKTDVWALGVMLYELLTGRLPFEGKNTWEILSASGSGDVIPPRRKYRHAPDQLQAICLKSLRKDPALRYETAAELAEELLRWLRGDPVLAKSPTITYYAWRWVARRRARVASALVAAVLLSSALAWAWHERARGNERARGMLEEIVIAVLKFEDQLLKTPLNPQARELLAKQPRNLLDRMVQDDDDFGPAYSWRGKVRWLLGLEPESESDFAAGCAATPDDAEVWFVRGTHRIGLWMRLRGLPEFVLGEKGVALAAARPETEEEKRLREEGLADLERMEQAGVKRDAFVQRGQPVGRAMAALAAGKLEEAVASAAVTIGPRAARVRGAALYLQGKFDLALLAFWDTVGNWPQDRDAWRWLWLAREAEWASRQGVNPGEVRGRWERLLADCEKSVAAADAARKIDLEAAKKAGIERLNRDDTDLVHAFLKRGIVLTELGGLEGEAGKDPRERCLTAVSDFDQGYGIWNLDQRKAEMLATLLNRGRARLVVFEANASAAGKGNADHFEQAAKELSQVVTAERNPEVGEAYALRGRAYAGKAVALQVEGSDPREALAKAEADFKTAVEKKYPLAGLATAEFCRSQGRYDEAVGWYGEAARSLPHRAAWVAEQVRETLAERDNPKEK